MNQIISGGLLFLLSFQLLRFYQVIPPNQLLCDNEDHSHALSPVDHHHHAEAAPIYDGKAHITHCKDTYAGVALTPNQPLALPAAVFRQALPVIPAVRTGTVPSTPEAHLPPPFQPPRIS